MLSAIHSHPSLSPSISPLSLSLSLFLSLFQSLCFTLSHYLLCFTAEHSLSCPAGLPACNAINLRKNFCHLLNWKFLAAGQLIPFAVIDSSTRTRTQSGKYLSTFAMLFVQQAYKWIEVSLMLARKESNAIRLIDSPLASSKLCIHRIYC